MTLGRFSQQIFYIGCLGLENTYQKLTKIYLEAILMYLNNNVRNRTEINMNSVVVLYIYIYIYIYITYKLL